MWLSKLNFNFVSVATIVATAQGDKISVQFGKL